MKLELLVEPVGNDAMVWPRWIQCVGGAAVAEG